jgi:hypothetical protein
MLTRIAVMPIAPSTVMRPTTAKSLMMTLDIGFR